MGRKSSTTASSSVARKRLPRPALLFRVSFVLVAALLLVIGFVQGGTWLTIHRLTARIHSADDAQAPRLVKELAQFEGPAYHNLVAAAASPRSAVALAARLEIDTRTEDWRRTAFLQPASFDLTGRALPLATALANHHEKFTVGGRRWARRVLVDLLSLTASQPQASRLALVQACDQALSAMPHDEPLPLPEPDVDYRVTLASPPVANRFAASSRPPAAIQSPQAPAPLSIRIQPNAESSPPPPTPTTPDVAGRLPRENRADSNQPSSSEPSEWNPNWSAQLDRVVEANPSPEPVAQPSPPVPKSRVPAHSASTTRLAPPPTSLATDRTAVDVRAAPSVSSREETILFRMLARADGSAGESSPPAEQQTYAAEQLLLRGFGHVTPRDARMAISASPNDRRALVDLVLTSSRLESRKWLWRLAHDASGEVRTAALASIATSADRELIEAALDLALHDTDPRVAEQANTLRDRRR